MSKLQYIENPTEEDFPLIDRCAMCDQVCDWQPRYEMASRLGEHFQMLSSKRPMDYVPESRVVKICAGCVPDDNSALRQLIRGLYPVYAKRKGI